MYNNRSRDNERRDEITNGFLSADAMEEEEDDNRLTLGWSLDYKRSFPFPAGFFVNGPVLLLAISPAISRLLQQQETK